MSDPAGPRHKNLFLTVAALLAVWGILGVLDVAKQPSTGYSFNNNVITNVVADGPAASAGLQVGDSLVSIAGLAMEDLSDLRRGEIGQARTIVVQRAGREMTTELTHAAQSGGDALGSYLGILIGALFLVMGLWAYLRAEHPGTRLLALLGCIVGPLFLSGPYLAPGTLTSLLAAVSIMGVVMGLAVLLDFVLRSGRPNGYEEGGGGPTWLYWPAAVMALVVAVLVTAQPNIDGILGTLLQIVLGAFFLGYFGGSLFMVVRNYMRSEASLRSSRGLGLMLAGAIIGLAPLTISFLLSLLPGDLNVPGLQYVAFGIVAVPITFALAAVKGRGRAAPAEAGGAAPAM